MRSHVGGEQPTGVGGHLVDRGELQAGERVREQRHALGRHPWTGRVQGPGRPGRSGRAARWPAPPSGREGRAPPRPRPAAGPGGLASHCRSDRLAGSRASRFCSSVVPLRGSPSTTRAGPDRTAGDARLGGELALDRQPVGQRGPDRPRANRRPAGVRSASVDERRLERRQPGLVRRVAEVGRVRCARRGRGAQLVRPVQPTGAGGDPVGDRVVEPQRRPGVGAGWRCAPGRPGRGASSPGHRVPPAYASLPTRIRSTAMATTSSCWLTHLEQLSRRCRRTILSGLRQHREPGGAGCRR